MQINGKTKLYGLIGWPVEHTFSPAMHNAAFEALGINAVYVPLAVEEKNFAAALKGLAALGFSGFNVTIPYKERIIPYLSEVEEGIEKAISLIKAVNTVIIKDGKLFGHNTDWWGAEQFIGGKEIEGKGVFIFGAGGAAKAVVAGIECWGVNFYITDVVKEKAESLANDINKYSEKSKAEGVSGLENKATLKKLKEADLVINATGIGLRKEDSALVKPEWIRKEQIAYDLIYNPPLTNFLKVYKEKGAKVLNGEGMLLYQAVEAFKLFTGEEASVEVMREALRKEVERLRQMDES